MRLFITADRIGEATGGGQVTAHEFKALVDTGDEVGTINPPAQADPFETDRHALATYKAKYSGKVSHAHGYAGCFTETIKALKQDGAYITWSVAAHDVGLSRLAYADIGAPFPYPHLTQPELFKQYTEGYRLADLIICPSRHSEKVLRSQGIKNIRIINHGTTPADVPPMPDTFTLGYLGSYGADKGIVWLLRAWAQCQNVGKLILGGKDSHTIKPLIESMNLKNIELHGWYDDVNEFYSRISCYVQPSTTEGWGLEVSEAQARGRPTIATDGCGAADIATVVVPSRNADALAKTIKWLSKAKDVQPTPPPLWVDVEREYLDAWKPPPDVWEWVPTGKLKVNFGSFTCMAKDWLNLDILDLRKHALEHGRKFLQHDIRTPLPFENGSVDLATASHVIEHLTYNEAGTFLKECKRVLRGPMRIAVPDVERLARMYADGRLGELDATNEDCAKHDTQAGKLWHMLTGNHQSCYDFTALECLARQAGFSKVSRCEYRQGHPTITTQVPDLHEAVSLFIELDQ